MKRIFLTASLVGGCILSAGCMTRSPDLTYRPAPGFVRTIVSQPQIAGIVVYDHRPEKPKLLATIINLHGDPIAQLHTNLSVKDEVAHVFGQALSLRGEVTHSALAPLVLQVDLDRFDADQYLRNQARIAMHMSLLDRRNNQIIYRDEFADQIMASQSDHEDGELQILAERVLSRSIDHLVDKPGFLSFATPTSVPTYP